MQFLMAFSKIYIKNKKLWLFKGLFTMHLLRNLFSDMANNEFSLKWFWEHLQSNESTVNFLQNHGNFLIAFAVLVP